MTDEQRILKLLPFEELLLMAAEEAIEKAQACLKLHRAMTGLNPTPKSFDECLADLVEEMADDEFCTELLTMSMGVETTRAQIEEIRRQKTARWLIRLNGAQRR